MENEKKIKMLQMFYAGVLADSVMRFEKEGILNKISEEKKKEQFMYGKMRAVQMGIQKPNEVFEILAEIFGCADWKVEKTDEGFEARAEKCMLCALSKKLATASPCNIYCLDAMEGMIMGIDEKAEYSVKSTLWDKDECRVIVKTKE